MLGRRGFVLRLSLAGLRFCLGFNCLFFGVFYWFSRSFFIRGGGFGFAGFDCFGVSGLGLSRFAMRNWLGRFFAHTLLGHQIGFVIWLGVSFNFIAVCGRFATHCCGGFFAVQWFLGSRFFAVGCLFVKRLLGVMFSCCGFAMPTATGMCLATASVFSRCYAIGCGRCSTGLLGLVRGGAATMANSAVSAWLYRLNVAR